MSERAVDLLRLGRHRITYTIDDTGVLARLQTLPGVKVRARSVPEAYQRLAELLGEREAQAA